MSFEPHDLCDTNAWVQILYRPEFFLGLYSRLVIISSIHNCEDRF